MKKLLVIALWFVSFMGHAQTDEKGEVMAVVNRVFEAMRTNDSTLLKTCFTENPNTNTVLVDPEGNTRLVSGDFQKFKDAVGKDKEVVWDEPIWNEEVRMDGRLAAVWVDYAFYAGKNFSHCGVDAFHLVKEQGVWRIFHLVDTRRKSDCDVPKEVADRFK